MKNRILLFLLIIMNASLSVAQNDVARGKVTDEKGDPLVGVSVAVKGTTVGTTTDVNGQFTLKISKNKAVVFSFIGYEKREVVAPEGVLNVTLNPTVQTLDDVIVVAYGKISKAGYTGSASTVGRKEIAQSQVSSVSRLLQGAASGVQSSALSGQPGSDASIFIRGIGSINASSSPLYIVDGAPYDGELNALNPSDIESINVLKDAASTALYGSRAGNGLVIITTKQGVRNQRAKIEARFSYGSSSRAVSDYEQVSTNDYYKLYWEAMRNQQVYVNKQTESVAAGFASQNIVSNLGINPYGSKYSQPVGIDGNIVAGATPLWNDNWSKEYVQKAHREDAQLNIQGGTNNSTYFISLGYLSDKGIALASDFKRYSGRLNFTTDLRKWLRLSTNLSLSHSVQNAPAGDDSSTANSLNFARSMPSFYPIWERDLLTGAFKLDSQGNRVVDYGWYRPSSAMPGVNHIGTSIYDFDKKVADNATLRTSVEVDLYKGLLYKGSVNIDYTNSADHSYSNPKYGNSSQQDFPGSVNKGNQRKTGFTANNVLSYNTVIDKMHNLKILIGQEYYEYNTNSLAGSRSGFPLLGLTEPIAASQLNSFTGTSSQYKLLSYFGNLDYNYNYKYYASASIRRDGSSRFAPTSRWGTFWSIGGSWRISEEEFLKPIKAINKLALRASYGGQGNDQIGNNFAFLNLFDINNNLGESGFVTSSLANENLKWETNLNLNIGLDFAFLNNRVYGSVEYFNRRSKDLLFTLPKAPSTGYSGYPANIGALKNSGYEVQLSGVAVKSKDWSWTISANATHYKNEITELPQEKIESGNKLLRVGGSIYDFFIPEWGGIDPVDGLPQWYKTDATGVRVKTKVYNEANTTESKIIAGSSLPTLVGGFNTNLRFRDFEFSALFAYSLGGKIYNQDKLSILHNGTAAGDGMSVDLLNRWTPTNTNTDVPRLGTSFSSSWTSTSTRFLVDGDYLRLKNVTLAYNLPKSLLKKATIENCRLYVQAENLLTLFGQQGLDPEQAINGTSYFRYPAMKTISLGINLSF